MLQSALRPRKRAGLDQAPLSIVYTSCASEICSREYGCQIWNLGATQYLSDDVERIQKQIWDASKFRSRSYIVHCAKFGVLFDKCMIFWPIQLDSVIRESLLTKAVIARLAP
jgi:hypothetical protein